MFESIMGAIFVDSGKDWSLITNIMLNLIQNGMGV
jgi:dsRNA-specific ribonuclease